MYSYVGEACLRLQETSQCAAMSSSSVVTVTACMRPGHGILLKQDRYMYAYLEGEIKGAQKCYDFKSM